VTQQAVPYVMQALSHGAQLFRQAISTLVDTEGGVIHSGDYQVTALGSPAMAVNVAGGVPGGQAWVAGTTIAGVQGLYYCYNDAQVTVGITGSDPSNPRIDIIALQIQDAFYAGAINSASIAYVSGTPAGSPVPPTTPASSILLADIAVAALATSITTGNITNIQNNVLPPSPPIFTMQAANTNLGVYGQIPSGTPTNIDVSTGFVIDPLVDTDGGWDGSGTYTTKTPGYWSWSVQGQWIPIAGGTVRALSIVDESGFLSSPDNRTPQSPSAGDFNFFAGSGPSAVGNTFQFSFYQDSGTTLAFNSITINAIWSAPLS
jgi:hypothetical protein